MAKLAFKQSKGGTYRFKPFSGGGVSGMGSRCEGNDPNDSSWHKINEESIVEGTIGSINDINDYITKMTIKMEKQKVKLQKLIKYNASGLSTSSCSGHVACSVPGKLSTYASKEISVLQGEIDLLDMQINFLGYLKTYLGIMKANNMYYRVEP